MRRPAEAVYPGERQRHRAQEELAKVVHSREREYECARKSCGADRGNEMPSCLVTQAGRSLGEGFDIVEQPFRGRGRLIGRATRDRFGKFGMKLRSERHVGDLAIMVEPETAREPAH